MTLIQAVDLTKRFGDQLAVDSVSLGVGRGEVVGFLGPNGAGKSTTMRMITGFLEPDAGTSAICGHDVASDPIAAKRHLGYLPEGAPGYADMTVSDFLTFIGKIRGLDATKLNDRLAEMVERIRLTEVWNKPIDTLSKGFKRRVGIAQALIHDPDVLILDEPTDGLDPNQKYEMRSLISGISAEKAIVISTHILEEVEAICSRAVIIAEGRVVADATPDELIERATRPSAIRVTVASTETDDIVARIKPVAGTERIEVMERFNGSTRVLVDVGEDQSETADFARAVRDTGLVVEEVARHRPRLEDVFRDITRSDRAS